jgi:hypothetical protein
MKQITTPADAYLVMALYFHQGGGSPVGQSIRIALGLGRFDNIPPRMLWAAKRILAPHTLEPVCLAYEHGFNDAIGTSPKQNPNPEGSAEAIAWAIGWEKGRQAVHCAPVGHADFVDSTWPQHGDGGKDAW